MQALLRRCESIFLVRVRKSLGIDVNDMEVTVTYFIYSFSANRSI